MRNEGLEYICPSCERTVVLAHLTTATTVICPHCNREMDAHETRGVQFVGAETEDDNYRLDGEDAPQQEDPPSDQQS